MSNSKPAAASPAPSKPAPGTKKKPAPKGK